jgi:hypothetical protein
MMIVFLPVHKKASFGGGFSQGWNFMRDSIKEKHFQHRSQKFYSAEFNKVNSVLKYKCSILIFPTFAILQVN